MKIHPWLWLASIVALSTGASAVAEKQPAALMGAWGGDRLNLELSSAGGSLSLDCATGAIDGPVRPDSRGHFKAKGQWETHSGGPQRADEPPPSASALFEGHVANGTMHLNVIANGALQTFSLTQGKRVKLVRCL